MKERPLQTIVEFNRQQVRIDDQLSLVRWMVTEDAILSCLAAQTGTIELALVTVRDRIYADTDHRLPTPTTDGYRIAAASTIESLLFPLDEALW